MVKQTESSIFVDFPGHDDYATVIKTITLGDVDRAQGMFHVTLHRVGPDNATKKVLTTDVDIKRQFLIHTYNALLDFLTDFQKTRSVKPTKRVLSDIKN